MSEIKFLKPFTRFCMTIGNLPSSYLVSMTYEEQLLWLCDYLEKTVIPTINNNSEVTKEIQDLFNQLKNYVEHYFDNLDVQQEINNKLDEMVEDGSLENILYNYTKIQRIYNTVNDMINDESLTLNQKIKCLGLNSINDGFGGEFIINNENGIDLNNGLKALFINNYQDNFYNNIYYEKEIVNNTSCYLTYIPKNDNNGKQIDFYVDKCEPLSPNEYSIKNNTNLTTNASNSYKVNGVWTYGNVIANGEIINNFTFTDNIPEFYQYLGITENREFKTYNARYTTAEQMIADGCKNAFLIFAQTVNNGIIIEHTEDALTKYAPVQMLGVKLNGDVIMLTTDGRALNDVGLNYQSASQLLISKGCINCYMFDGGGSASTSFKGVKINKNFDRKGTKDRAVPYCLNVKNNIINKNIADVYGFIGNVKQNIIENIIPMLPDAHIITAPNNLNDIIGKIYMCFVGGNTAIQNKPSDSISGYFINIPDLNDNAPRTLLLNNKQLFFDFDSNIFTREQIDGIFNEWRTITNAKTMLYKDNYTINNTNYQNIPVIIGRKDNNLVKMINESHFTINTKKIVSVNSTLVITPSSNGQKYIRLVDENNNVLNSVRFTATQNQITSIPFLAVLNANPNKNYTLQYSGSVNDILNNVLMLINI